VTLLARSALTSSGFACRTYQGGDEAELVACWNRSLPRDRVTLHRFVRTTLLDANFDPAGLVEGRDRDGVLRGFVHATAERTGPAGREGWICALLVDPASRRHGLGSHLLRLAESYLADRGCGRVTLTAYPPAYYLPGIDAEQYPGAAALLGSSGYHVAAEVVAMDRSLVDYEVPESVQAARQALAADGWWFGPAAPEHYLGLLRLAGEFAPDWAEVVRGALQANPDEGQIKLAAQGDVIGGFAMFGAYPGCPDRFGPFGVDPAVRNKGLGAVLLHECLAEMAARQMHAAWFLWTGEREAAGRLYLRSGFTVTRRFSIYAKDLAGQRTAGGGPAEASR
jgi:ribosomal protein S18 acetylase RimI-like enzyme